MQRLNYSKPCPGTCGTRIDLQAELCWPCRTAEGRQLAERLPALMGALDMNAEQLAHALGIKSASVRQWLSHRGSVPRAYHADIRFVLADAVPPPPGPSRAERPLKELVRIVEPTVIVKAPEPPQPPPKKPRWELYCLLCGRGTGPGGVLVWTRILPTHTDPCRDCGGIMLARELFSERDLEDNWSRRAA